MCDGDAPTVCADVSNARWPIAMCCTVDTNRIVERKKYILYINRLTHAQSHRDALLLLMER